MAESEERCDSKFWSPKGCRARCIRPLGHDDDQHYNSSQKWSTEAAARSFARYQTPAAEASR